MSAITANGRPDACKPLPPSTWEDFSIPADCGYPLGGTSIRTSHEVDWSSLSGHGKPRRCYLWFTSQGLSLIVGSGGTAGYLFDEDTAWDSVTTTAMPKDLFRTLGKPEVATAASSKASTSAVLPAADLVAEVKATLGIKVTDLAAIAKVSRQTLYDWIDGGTINLKNYDRLFALRQVCQEWQAMAKKPIGQLVHAKTEDGTSLLDLLQRDEVDEAAIRTLLVMLAARMAGREAEQQQRASKLERLGDKAYRENLLAHSRPATDS